MMVTTTARVPTQSGSKYMQQLCKHWSHKLEVEFDAEKGRVELPGAQAIMLVESDALVVTLAGEDDAAVTKMQEVVAVHLDRFAFREAPLAFDWK